MEAGTTEAWTTSMKEGLEVFEEMERYEWWGKHIHNGWFKYDKVCHNV